MDFTRRDTLALGFTGMAALAGTTILPFAARAQTQGDRYPIDGGELVIDPISHASFVMSAPGLVIYNDPVGGKDLYAGQASPTLILVTHEHEDHYDAATLQSLLGPDTKLVVNPAVLEKLPADLKARATALKNGESATVATVGIEAVAAYNTTADRLKYHPQGRDNGYVLTIGGRRVYIAGDTEDIPEMRALSDIFVAFVPMNLPYTMDIDQAASAVAAFKPQYVYPYHYKGSDPVAFAAKVASAGATTQVVQGKWYG